MRIQFALVALIVFSASQYASAENWPHWRGEKGNSVSTSATPPIEWSPTKNVKWKVEIPGRSSASPIIWEDKVFVVSAVEKDPAGPLLAFNLYCFNRADGKLLWERTCNEAVPHEGTHSTNGFASASPCTDGEHVYAHFGSNGLFCYTLDGEKVWERTDLGKMKCRGTFGEGSSPTLVDDKIIVPWDHEGPSYIAALDKNTGKTIWKTERDEPTCWATPLIVEHAGKKQIVMNGQTKARAYDVETGKEIWNRGGQTQRPVASALQLEDMVIIASGFRGSFVGAFKLGGEGDIEGTSYDIWNLDRDTPDIASPVLSGNRLYYTKAKSGVLTCVNAKTGEYFFGPERVAGLKYLYASPIAANGHIYYTDRDGTVVVLKDSEELEIVSTNNLGEGIDATPAPVDNELFIRGEKHLFCVSE